MNLCQKIVKNIWKTTKRCGNMVKMGGCGDENDDGVDGKKESNGSKPSNSQDKI